MSSLKDKLRDSFQKHLNPEEILKNLCPFSLQLKIAVLANTTYRKVKHDYCILMMVTGDEPFIDDPRDMEAFIAQITGERKDFNFDILVDTVKHEGEVYTALFLDKKKAKTP